MTVPEAHYYLSRSLLGMSYHDLVGETRRLKRANRKLEKTIRRLAEENGDETGFALRNSPATKKPWRGSVPQNTRQTLLITGMDCLPGQRDLFETDGEAAAANDNRLPCRARAGRRGTPDRPLDRTPTRSQAARARPHIPRR